MMKELNQIIDKLSKENDIKKEENKPKKNKKKGKKNKFKDSDIKIEEYDEQKEKEERDEILKLLKESFSLTDDEMTELLNYYFEDDDLDDIDKLINIILNKFYGQENENIIDSANENSIKKDSSTEEKNKIDINKRSNIRDLLYSLKIEKKFN